MSAPPVAGQTAVLMVLGGDRWWSWPCPVIPQRCWPEWWQLAYDTVTEEAARLDDLAPADLTWEVVWR